MTTNKSLFYKILLILVFTISVNTISAQYYESQKKKTTSNRDKIFFGGGLGLQFGTLTIIDIKPLIGYKVTDRFHLGLELTYSYIKNNTNQFETDIYGASVFAKYYIYEGFFAQTQIEALNVEVLDVNNNISRMWLDNYYIGAGYLQKFGGRGGMYIMALWNLNQSEYSLYSNPLISIGFTF